MMTLDDIMALTGFSKPTVYRWMTERDRWTDRLRWGFPLPLNRPFKPALWSETAVRAWWEANKHRCGRWGRGHNDGGY